MVRRMKTGADCQQGGIMLMALMILLLLAVLGTAIIEIGLMESKSSHYAREEQQAQQAADAGVEWGMEKIYLELQQPSNLSAETLPVSLSCGNAVISLAGPDETGQAIIGEVSKIGSGNEGGQCTYEYSSTGLFRGGRKRVTVQIIYYFAGGYQYQDGDGQLSFVPRQYYSRGQIIYYAPSN
jgi:Tfp pilus assembly protein PilX